jgi:hypothetical protein
MVCFQPITEELYTLIHQITIVNITGRYKHLEAFTQIQCDTLESSGQCVCVMNFVKIENPKK